MSDYSLLTMTMYTFVFISNLIDHYLFVDEMKWVHGTRVCQEWEIFN